MGEGGVVVVGIGGFPPKGPLKSVFEGCMCVRAPVRIPPLAGDVPPVIGRMMWRSMTSWCSV